jgi:hypothetical protein
MVRVFIVASALATVVGFFYSARSLRRLLYLLFFFSLIEGVYINYFYPRQIFLVAKDFIVAYIYLLFVAQGHLQEALRRTGALLLPVAVYAGLYILHVFNPLQNDVLVGLIGLRVAIFYIPLVLVAQVAFRNREELTRFLKFCLALTTPVCLYGIYQYFGGEAHIMSLGPGYVQRGVAILHGAGSGDWTFRTLSTFTYSSSFSLFILMMVPLMWAVVRSAETKRSRNLAIATLVLLFAAQVSTGGRQALILTALALLLTDLLYGRGLVRKIVAPLVTVAGILLGFFLFGQGKVARYETILDMAQVKWRYEMYFVRHNLEAIQKSPLGQGSGSASVAARHVGGTKFWATETALSKIVYETGIPGFLAFVWMLVALLRRLWRVQRGLQSRDLVLYARAMFALSLVVLGTSFNGWPLDVPPVNALFWLFAGLALAAPVFESAEAAAPQMGEAAVAAPAPA